MAYLLGLILVLFSSFVFATTPIYTTTHGGANGSSIQNACDISWSSGWVQINYQQYGWAENPASGTSCESKYQGTNQSVFGTVQAYDSVSISCPTGYTLSADQSTCTSNTTTCPSGQSVNTYTGQCQATCPTGQYPTTTWVGVKQGTTGLPDMCMGGCVINSDTCGSAGGSTVCMLGNVTGAFCDPSKTYVNQGQLPTLTPEQQCIEKGDSYGYVNGQVVCVSPMTNGAQPLTQNTNNGNGTQTQTTTNPSNQTVNQTTTNTNTNTTTNTTQTTNDFCSQNPNLSICQTSSAGNTGNCSSAPACTGDAVQCAILHQLWSNGCADQGTSEQQLYVAAANGQDVKSASSLAAGSSNGVIDFSTSIDQTDSLAGQTCIDDYQWSVLGSSINVPFSKLCPVLGVMRTIVIAFSLIAGMAIIYKGMT